MKYLHNIFAVIAVAGLLVAFFAAGASDADSFTLKQVTQLGIASIICMAGGFAGYMATVEVHVK